MSEGETKKKRVRPSSTDAPVVRRSADDMRAEFRERGIFDYVDDLLSENAATWEELATDLRSSHAVRVRVAICVWMRTKYRWSWVAIARLLGIDHSTAIKITKPHLPTVSPEVPEDSMIAHAAYAMVGDAGTVVTLSFIPMQKGPYQVRFNREFWEVTQPDGKRLDGQIPKLPEPSPNSF